MSLLKRLAKLYVSFARHPIYTTFSVLNANISSPADLEQCLRDAADWLLVAQANATDGDGFSRKFSLVTGWDKAYIETTGYIIPTLIDVSRFLGDDKYKDSAFKAANWLLTVQTAEGAFTDIDQFRPHVFDTGQVLLGLNRIFVETGDERFIQAADAASRWLIDQQDPSGCWIRHAYLDRPHAYYTRVAAALIEAGQLTGNPAYVAAGRKNLEWAVRQKQPNGYFRYSEFKQGEPALLHTIVYVLEGFLMSYQLTGEKCWADLAVSGAEKLAELSDGNGLPYAQYDSDWREVDREYCVTGLAQYAGVCCDIAAVSGDHDFKLRGERILDALSIWQQRKGMDIAGALQSSFPIWGSYGGMEFYNWNVKFFIDAIIKFR